MTNFNSVNTAFYITYALSCLLYGVCGKRYKYLRESSHRFAVGACVVNIAFYGAGDYFGLHAFLPLLLLISFLFVFIGYLFAKPKNEG